MPAVQDNVRIGRTTADLKQAILDNLYYIQTRIPDMATTHDWYMAVAYAVRDRMMNDWIQASGVHEALGRGLSATFRRSLTSVRSWVATYSMCTTSATT